jgi:hypothetical protein
MSDTVLAVCIVASAALTLFGIYIYDRKINKPKE